VDAAGPDAPIRLVEAPRAPAGSGDPSRRWALAFADGAERFPGITRPEGDAAAAGLAAMHPDGWDAALVEVVLAVVLSDGAGPYLIDAVGRITLVLAAHPALPGVHLAMGEPVPDHRIGLVRRRPGVPVWEWIARAEVSPAARVAALDALDAITDPAGAGEWERAARR
jgi:hypothetical protein